MTSQPNEVQVTVDANSHCNNDCYMIADVTNHIYTCDTNGKTSGSQSAPAPTTYLIFRAYSITSAYLSNGVCTTISGGAITLPTPYSLLKPATPYDQDSFRNSARSKFQSYAGYTGCSASGPSITPTENMQSVLRIGVATSAISLPTSIASNNSTSQFRRSASAASSHVPSRSDLSGLTNSPPAILPVKAKILVGVVVPLGIISLLLFCAVFRYKYRILRRKTPPYEDNGSEKDSSPYFQQKPELHGDQCRHEMPAEHKRHEVQAEEMRHQLQADERRLELEVCHCRHELEAPVIS